MTERSDSNADEVSPGLPDVASGYAPHSEHRPLTGYVVLSAAFAATFSGSLTAAHRHAGELPERVETRDIVLMGIATHKVTRLLAKDRVTSFLRAPFAEYQDRAGTASWRRRPADAACAWPPESC